MDAGPLGADLGDWPAGLELPGAGAEVESALAPPPYAPVLLARSGRGSLPAAAAGGRALVVLSRAACGALHGAAGGRAALVGAAFSPGIELDGYCGAPSGSDSGCWVYEVSGGNGVGGAVVLCQHGLGGGLAGAWVEAVLGALSPTEVVVIDCVLGAPQEGAGAPPMVVATGVAEGEGGVPCSPPVGAVRGLFPEDPAVVERLSDGAAEVLRWAAEQGAAASVLLHSQPLPVPGGADVERVAGPSGAILEAFLGVEGVDTKSVAAAAAARFDEARASSAAHQVYV